MPARIVCSVIDDAGEVQVFCMFALHVISFVGWLVQLCRGSPSPCRTLSNPRNRAQFVKALIDGAVAFCQLMQAAHPCHFGIQPSGLDTSAWMQPVRQRL